MSSIRSITFLRHARAIAEEGRPDAERSLTQKGRRQARLRGDYFDRVGFNPDVIIHSGVLRARTTAEAVFPYWLKPCYQLSLCPSPKHLRLEDHPRQGEIWQAETARAMFDIAPENFRRWINHVAGEVRKLAQSDPEHRNLLFLGHTPFLQMFAHVVWLSATGTTADDFTIGGVNLLDLTLGECEGFTIWRGGINMLPTITELEALE